MKTLKFPKLGHFELLLIPFLSYILPEFVTYVLPGSITGKAR